MFEVKLWSNDDYSVDVADGESVFDAIDVLRDRMSQSGSRLLMSGLRISKLGNGIRIRTADFFEDGDLIGGQSSAENWMAGISDPVPDEIDA